MASGSSSASASAVSAAVPLGFGYRLRAGCAASAVGSGAAVPQGIPSPGSAQGLGQEGDRLFFLPPDRLLGHAGSMELEIRVPLTTTNGVEPGDYAFPWIDAVEDQLDRLEDRLDFESDDGEEDGSDYVFFITGDDEGVLLKVARKIAAMSKVPPGAYAVIKTDVGAESGRRVELR